MGGGNVVGSDCKGYCIGGGGGGGGEGRGKEKLLLH